MGEIGIDTLRSAVGTCNDALLTLAWGFDDYGDHEKAEAVMDIRKQLIDAVRSRGRVSSIDIPMEM